MPLPRYSLFHHLFLGQAQSVTAADLWNRIGLVVLTLNDSANGCPSNIELFGKAGLTVASIEQLPYLIRLLGQLCTPAVILRTPRGFDGWRGYPIDRAIVKKPNRPLQWSTPVVIEYDPWAVYDRLVSDFGVGVVEGNSHGSGPYNCSYRANLAFSALICLLHPCSSGNAQRQFSGE